MTARFFSSIQDSMQEHGAFAASQTGISKPLIRGHWQTAYTYAERGLRSLRSTLTLGDRSTDDPVFNGIPFRGVMLASDESMVPYSERAFSPIVRGIARTEARVEVRQNGYLLYETTVARAICLAGFAIWRWLGRRPPGGCPRKRWQRADLQFALSDSCSIA